MFTISYRPNNVLKYMRREVTLEIDGKYIDRVPFDCTYAHSAREAYAAANRIGRLIDKGVDSFSAWRVGALNVGDYDVYCYELNLPIGEPWLSLDQRVLLYPISEACEGEGIISDWLTEEYADEFGLECGAEVSEQDLYYYFCLNFGNDVPVPAYLQDEARNWGTIGKRMTTNLSDDWEGHEHAKSVSY